MKTLKELKESIDGANDGSGYLYDEGSISLYELRKEVIKWIKERDNRRFFLELFPDGGGTTVYGESMGIARLQIETWIKHFFNITEEDLMTNEEINAKIPKTYNQEPKEDEINMDAPEKPISTIKILEKGIWRKRK